MTADPFHERIFNEQIDTLFRTFLVGVLGAWVAALTVLIALVAIGDQTWGRALLWGAAITGIVAFHLLLLRTHWQVPSSTRNRHALARWFTLASGLEGLWWGCAVIGLPAKDRFDEQIVINCLALIVASGAIPAFGAYLPAFIAILLPITLLSATWQVAQSGPLHMAVAFLIGIFLLTALGLGKRANFNLTELMRLRFEKDRLVDDLRRQKEQAEQANRAKSQFLASASHDLRQPVHALSMFVGALFNQPLSDELRRLALLIENSVQSLEGLFSALLDISRLDAGVVEPDHREFALAPVLHRVCSDHIGDAEQKGILLSVCRTSVYVHSDPVLLERILRNIVSNAVRYTDTGRILIGCRRGHMVRIEVWDTGHGIPEGEMSHIFDEFYQIGNLERDRTQGLGLGLAIVKRLTVLLDHPLTVVSTPGKGSGFKLSLPAAAPVRAALRDAPALSAAAISLAGTTVYVIDDDGAVLESMRSVLSGWGATVVTATSGAEILRYAAPGGARPNMILCDYRLRGGENGIEVIRAVQRAYGGKIPAVLITGDTASDRVKQAHVSEFAILYKPVSYGKLRALIGNLLRTPTTAPAHLGTIEPQPTSHQV